MKSFSTSILAFHTVVIVLTCCIACSSAWGFERKRKLLVLHSYHQGLQWTDSISEGIQSVFKQLQGSYEVHFEYLDAKRSSASRYQKRLLGYMEEPDHFHYFDVVIVSDNMGLEFVASNYVALFQDIPIVFCGINGYSPQLVDFTSKITGVVETTDYHSTIELMLTLHPEKNKILVILDRTPTGNLIAQEIKEVEKQFDHIVFEYYRDFVLQDVPAKLESLDNDYLIYQLTFNRDRNDAFISYSEGIEVVSRYSTVPVYGSWDFYLDKGIVGGVITTGYGQGQTAATLALRVLQGEPVESINIIDNAPTKVMFDYTYLTHYGVNPSRLPKDSVIINSPPSWMERNHKTVYRLSVIILSVLALFVYVHFRQARTLRSQKQLNDELDRRVKEKTLEFEMANRELARLSYVDELTELYNRRYFNKCLDKEWQRLQRVAQPLALLLCDIDFFKQYNDTYGHQAGDYAIAQVASLILGNVRRAAEIAARYGGEEFAVILPQTDLEGATFVAEKIRKSLGEKNIPHSNSSIKDRLSISIGVASVIPSNAKNPTQLLSLADEALYMSKKRGRDQVSSVDQIAGSL